MKYLSSLLVILFFQAQAAFAQPSDTTRLIDALFARWHNASPGGAILVARGEKIIYDKAFGMAHLEHNVANTIETVFETGSVAKQFAAMAILILASEGKLSLQDDIRKYVPEMPVYQAPVTIQHLLNHTSGLKDWGAVGSLTGWPRTTRIYTQALGLQIMTKQKTTNFLPGNEYSYSNSNYLMMAFIVERVSKQSFSDFTRTRFFEPLGMTQTQWRDNFRKVVPNRAVAYSGSGKTFSQDMPFENVHAHGGLLTTTADLLKWNSLLENHRIGGEAVYQWRIKKGKLNNGRDITYAAGLTIGEVNRFTEISHSGATAGYRAWLAFYPQKKLSVILLSNDGTFNPVAAGKSIAEIILGKTAARQNERPRITLSETELKKFNGIFRSVRHFDVQKLEFKNGRITSNNHEVNASHRDTLYLDNLKWAYSKPNQIRVIRGADYAGDTLTYIKVNPPDTSAVFLNSIMGSYRSDEADVTYAVEVKDKALWVVNAPFPAFRLSPSFLGGFYFEDQLFEFKRSKGGKWVLEVSLSRAERIPFIKKEK